jgi:hypothetical protein
MVALHDALRAHSRAVAAMAGARDPSPRDWQGHAQQCFRWIASEFGKPELCNKSGVKPADDSGRGAPILDPAETE